MLFRRTPRPDPFTAASHTRGRGRIAEAQAVAWLERKGYRMLETNFSARTGEIDAVALDGDTLCFIEVKARSSNEFGPAIAAVSHRKRRKLALTATAYLTSFHHDGPCRFDVLGLDKGEQGWEYTLIQDAFPVEGLLG